MRPAFAFEHPHSSRNGPRPGRRSAQRGSPRRKDHGEDRVRTRLSIRRDDSDWRLDDLIYVTRALSRGQIQHADGRCERILNDRAFSDEHVEWRHQNSAPVLRKTLYRRDDVIDQVMYLDLVGYVGIVVQDDFSFALRKSHSDRPGLAPKRRQAKYFRVELFTRVDVVHANHHAIYFLEHWNQGGASVVLSDSDA